MTKLIVAFRNFTNALNKNSLSNRKIQTPTLLKIILIETLNTITVAVLPAKNLKTNTNSG